MMAALQPAHICCVRERVDGIVDSLFDDDANRDFVSDPTGIVPAVRTISTGIIALAELTVLVDRMKVMLTPEAQDLFESLYQREIKDFDARVTESGLDKDLADITSVGDDEAQEPQTATEEERVSDDEVEAFFKSLFAQLGESGIDLISGDPSAADEHEDALSDAPSADKRVRAVKKTAKKKATKKVAKKAAKKTSTKRAR
jgi:hypothetical protein